jgi:spore germination protein KC
LKNLFILLFIIAAIFLTSGCAFRDIDKRFFVVAMGIDPTESKEKPFKVSLKLDIPSAVIQPGKTRYQLLTEEAASIPEAIRVMESKVDKEFDFGHCRVLVFNKEMLKSDQKKLFDWFIRRRDIQGISYLGLGKPSARAVLASSAKSERLPGNALILAFDESVNTSPYVITEILNDYYMRLNEDGIDAYLPIIEPIKGTYVINTCAIMKGTRYKGELNKDETRMLNEFENTPRRGQISVHNNKANFFIFVDKLKTKMKLVYPKGKHPYADVTIKISGMVEESDEELMTSNELKKYEKIANEVVNKRAVKFFKHLQKMEVDPFGLGLKYEAKYGVSKKDTENWKMVYQNMDFHVHTKIDLRGSGTMY